MHTPAQSLDCEQVALAYWHLCPGLKDYSANPHCRALSLPTVLCAVVCVRLTKLLLDLWCSHNQLANKSPPFIDFWETHTLLGSPPSFSVRSQGQHPWSTMVGCSGGNAAYLVLQSVWHGIDCHVVLMLHSISCPHTPTHYKLSWGQ